MHIPVTANAPLTQARRKCVRAAIAEAVRKANSAAAGDRVAELTKRETRTQIEAAMREAEEAMRQSGPAIARALENAHAGDAAAHALRKADMKQALAEARAAVEQANIDAQIRVQIDEALAKAHQRRDSASGDFDGDPDRN